MIVATLNDGVTQYVIVGGSVAELEAELTAESLTGSAVPLADKVLVTPTGKKIPYADVARLEDIPG